MNRHPEIAARGSRAGPSLILCLALAVLAGCGEEPPAGRPVTAQGARTIPAALAAETLAPVAGEGEVLPIVLVDRRARRLVVLGEDRAAPPATRHGIRRLPAGRVLDRAGREGLTFEETVARLERMQACGELACEVMDVETDARMGREGRYGDDDPVLR